MNYCIFDREHAENCKNINHNYFRFINECNAFVINSADYLPMPSVPAKQEFEHLDVNDTEFYKKIREKLTRSETDANFIIIAYGSDLENIDMAEKLDRKCRERGVENYEAFIKVRAWEIGQLMPGHAHCHFIGNEENYVYNYDVITGDSIYRMAQMRNQIYDLEYNIIHNPGKELIDDYINEIRNSAMKNWYVKKSA